MNTKQLNSGVFNSLGGSSILEGLLPNFTDIVSVCPPVITYAPPQNRNTAIAAKIVAIVPPMDDEAVTI